MLPGVIDVQHDSFAELGFQRSMPHVVAVLVCQAPLQLCVGACEVGPGLATRPRSRRLAANATARVDEMEVGDASASGGT